MKPTIGIVGVGLMGGALAERLLAAGFPVLVHDLKRSQADAAVALGAKWSEQPPTDCDRLIFSLFTTDDVERVLGDVEDQLRPGQIVIDTTTGSPEQMEALGGRLAERGVAYLDALISGSSEQTRGGDVTILCGGCPETFEACAEVLDAISPRRRLLGNCGAGARMKLVTNLVLGLNRAALAEGLAYAESVGFSAEEALEVLQQSAAASAVMPIKGPKMIAQDFTPQAKLRQHHKDVRLILDSANMHLPLSEAHAILLQAAERAGYGEQDNSAVIQVWRQGTAASE